jgi:hypothetical protein
MIGSADTGRAETDLAAGWPARGCAARLQPWGHARSGDARPRHDNAGPARRMSSSSPLGSTSRSLRLLRGYALVAALLLRTSWGFKTVGDLNHNPTVRHAADLRLP